MILVVDSFNGNDFSLRQNLYNFCAELCERSFLHGCLISYPNTVEERNWVQPFVGSLKSAGVQRVNLLLSTKSFHPNDVPAIEAMGISEIIFIEDNPDYHFISSEEIGVRVWLTGDGLRKNHEKICNWHEFVKHLLSVEPVPPQFNGKQIPETSLKHHALQHSDECAMEHALVFISENGSAQNMADNCNLPRFLVQWKKRLPVKVFCNDCGPFALTELPGWLHVPDRKPEKENRPIYYFDHVKGNLDKMSARKSTIVKKEFLERVKQNATAGNKFR